MSSFEPTFVSSQANKFIEMIKECDENYFPKVSDFLSKAFLKFKNLYFKVPFVSKSWYVLGI